MASSQNSNSPSNDISLTENPRQFVKKQTITQTTKNCQNMTKRGTLETEHSLKLLQLKMDSTKMNVEEFEEHVNTYKPNTNQFKNIDKLATALNIIHTQNIDQENLYMLVQQYVKNKTLMFNDLQNEYKLLKDQDDFNQSELEQYIEEIEQNEAKIKDLEEKLVKWKEHATQKMRETNDVFIYYLISLFLAIIYSYCMGMYGYYDVIGFHLWLLQNIFLLVWTSFTGTLHIIVNTTTMINDTAAYILS